MKKPPRSPNRKTTAKKTTGKKKNKGTRRKPIMRHSREGKQTG